MENFVIATNTDGRVEAFYTEDNKVYHTWQLNPNNKTAWSQGVELSGTNGTLSGVNRISVASNLNGKIQVVAYSNDDKYYICYQTVNGPWTGWFEINQQ